MVREAGLPLTINAVVHRQNLDRLSEIVELALALGADRLEIAHVQYYGWALPNRAALLPSRDQLDRATALVEAARVRLKGVLTIDYVVPDYYARRPKACMGGWARRFLNVTPAGNVLPCHAAETLQHLHFPNVAEASLAHIWYSDPVFRPLPRDPMDARAVPVVRASRDRLGRMPLPSLRTDRRRQPHRSRVRPRPRSCAPCGCARRRDPPDSRLHLSPVRRQIGAVARVRLVAEGVPLRRSDPDLP